MATRPGVVFFPEDSQRTSPSTTPQSKGVAVTQTAAGRRSNNTQVAVVNTPRATLERQNANARGVQRKMENEVDRKQKSERERRRRLKRVYSCIKLSSCLIVVFFLVFLFNAINSQQRRVASETDTDLHALYVVTSPGNHGPGTLRDAIERANEDPLKDKITFEIKRPGTGIPAGDDIVIRLQSRLPNIVHPVLIDGANFHMLDDRIVVDGSETGVDCLRDTGAFGIGSLGADIPLFMLSSDNDQDDDDDDDDDDSNPGFDSNPSGSIIRNLVLRNEGNTKNNLESARGPCVGIMLDSVSNVTVKNCDFSGFTVGAAGILGLSTLETYIVGNTFDNVHNCMFFDFSAANDIRDNACYGFSRRSENDSGDPQFSPTTRGITFQNCLYNNLVHNTIEGYDNGIISVLSLYNRFEYNRVFGAVGTAFIHQFDVASVIIGNELAESRAGLESLVLANSRFFVHLANSVYNTTRVGVDRYTVEPDGVTENDFQDNDSRVQNHPTIESSSLTLHGAEVSGSLNSRPNSRFFIEFYITSSSVRSAKYRLGSMLVQSDERGDVIFEFRCRANAVSDAGVPACQTQLGEVLRPRNGHVPPLYTSSSATLLTIEGIPIECMTIGDIFDTSSTQNMIGEAMEMFEQQSARLNSTISAGQLQDNTRAANATSIASLVSQIEKMARRVKAAGTRPFCRLASVTTNLPAVCLDSLAEAHCQLNADGVTYSAVCPNANERPECPLQSSEYSATFRAAGGPISVVESSLAAPNSAPPSLLFIAALSSVLAATLVV